MAEIVRSIVQPVTQPLAEDVFTGLGLVNRTLLTKPSALVPTPPCNIVRVGSGLSARAFTDLDITAKRPTPQAAVFVGPGGNINNDALTYATRVPSWSLAIAIAGATFPGQVVNVLYETGGQHFLTTSRTRSGQPSLNGTYQDIWNVVSVNRPLCDLVIEPYDGVGSVDLIYNRAAPVWSATSDSKIWKTGALGASNVGASVADLKYLDADGQPSGFYMVYTVADRLNPYPELNAAWAIYSSLGMGVRYYDTTGQTMWVRLADDRPADALLRIHDSGTYPGFSAAATAGRTIWMKNVNVRGGAYGYRAIADGTNGFDVNTYAVDCAFTHSGGVGGQVGNWVHTGGGGEIIHLRTKTNYTVDDGIAYFDGGGRAPTFFEQDCVSRFNGMATSEMTCNAFTSHGACKGTRVNPTGTNSLDRTIHDINSTVTWDICPTVSNQRGTAGGVTSACIAVGQDGQTAKKWVDSPKFPDGANGQAQYPTEAYSGCTLNYANFPFTPNAGPGTGTVQPYAA